MSALIVRLRLGCGPSAIGRLVIAEWVDSVKRVFRRTRSHVFQERREVVAPSRAHRDADAAIVLVGARRLRMAARDHASPRRVLGAVAASEFAVATVKSRAIGLLVAAATLRVAVRQVFAFLGRALAAITETQPIRSAVSARRLTDDGEFAEPLPDQVCGIAAGMLSHLRALLFPPQAATALRRVAKVGARDDRAAATIASTDPRGRRARTNALNHGETSESMTAQVLQRITHSNRLYNIHSLEIGCV